MGGTGDLGGGGVSGGAGNSSGGSSSGRGGTGGVSAGGTSAGGTSSKGGSGGVAGKGGTGGQGGTGGGVGGAAGTSTAGGSSGSGGGFGCVPTKEVCDGNDNDCDGAADEGCACIVGDTRDCYSGDPSTKGIGVCNYGGTQTCDLNGVFGECVGEVVPALEESCNGLDDNCDGTVDEGFTFQKCGVGACTVTLPVCDKGVLLSCIPGAQQPEICDGYDNNCDGVVDEGCSCTTGAQQPCYHGSPTTLNIGACKAGTQHCVGGHWDTCSGEIDPSVELCNGQDDDCNGQVDEGLGTTVCGIGACQRTAPACLSGAPNSCVPGKPGTEVCNGIDDNCNGQIDEGTLQADCGDGLCQGGCENAASCAPDCGPLVFDAGDARRTSSTGDWAFGLFKGECGTKQAAIGISVTTTADSAHALLCSVDSLTLDHGTSSGCHAVDFSTGDNGVTMDWDPDYFKGQCAANEFVAGVAEIPSGNEIAQLLCCPGAVSQQKCATLVMFGADAREAGATDAVPNAFTGECGPGRYIAGVSRLPSGGSAHAIYCCSP